MESMCPGCKYYTKNVLGKLMEKPDFVQVYHMYIYTDTYIHIHVCIYILYIYVHIHI